MELAKKAFSEEFLLSLNIKVERLVIYPIVMQLMYSP